MYDHFLFLFPCLPFNLLQFIIHFPLRLSSSSSYLRTRRRKGRRKGRRVFISLNFFNRQTLLVLFCKALAKMASSQKLLNIEPQELPFRCQYYYFVVNCLFWWIWFVGRSNCWFIPATYVVFLCILVWLVELMKQLSCTIRLSNNSTRHVAFKVVIQFEFLVLISSFSYYSYSYLPFLFQVMTTSPEKYVIRPNAGILPPGSSGDIEGVVEIFYIFIYFYCYC